MTMEEVERAADHALAGPLLRAPALHRRPDRRRARQVPRRQRHRPPRVPLRHGAGRRHERLDRVHRQGRSPRAPAGSVWAVGTEINLVNRLAHENPDKTVFCLDPVVCPCSTMYRIHPAYMAWTVEELAEGRVKNQVSRRRRDGALREDRPGAHARGRLTKQRSTHERASGNAVTRFSRSPAHGHLPGHRRRRHPQGLRPRAAG